MAWPPSSVRSPRNPTRTTPPRADAWWPIRSDLPGARPRTRPSVQCAEPVTGSSSMPARGQEARDEVVPHIIGLARHDHPTRLDRRQPREVRSQIAHGRRQVDLHHHIAATPPDPARRDAERLGQPRGRGRRGRRIGREVEDNPVALARGGQSAAARVEARRLVGRQGAGLPQDVRAGQRRVAAQVDLDGRREPAQREGVALIDWGGHVRLLTLVAADGHLRLLERQGDWSRALLSLTRTRATHLTQS